MEAHINGVRLAYDDVGNREGPCLLLIHGFPLDRRMWREQVAGLADVARLIVPDLRGHGESEIVPGPNAVEQHARDLCALLDLLDIKQTIVAGLSMGGYVAFAMWRQQPIRFGGLVLLDTRADADSPEARENRERSMARVREAGPATFAEEMAPRLLAQNSLGDERIRKQALDIMAAQSVEGTVAALQGLRDRPDSTATLATITVPTLVVVGAEDTATPPGMAHAMAGAIPRARIAVIPGAGHLSPLENPIEVNRALASFVYSVASS